MDTTFVRNASGLRARVAEMRAAARKRRQRGLTLIEAAMVLGVLAVVVGGIMWVFTATNQNRQTSTALTQLTTIVERVRTLYGGQSSFTGLNNAALIDTQSLPASMVSGTTLRHAFNAAITVQAAEAAGGANSGCPFLLKKKYIGGTRAEIGSNVSAEMTVGTSPKS